MAVSTEAVWSKGPAIQMVLPSTVKNRTPDTKFYVRPSSADGFDLSQEMPGIETSELLLAKLYKEDHQFANCMLVLVADAMEKIMERVLESE